MSSVKNEDLTIFSTKDSSPIDDLIFTTETSPNTNENYSYNNYLTHYWPICNSDMTDHIGSAHMTQGFNTSFVEDRFGNENSALALNGGWTQVQPGVYFNTPGFTISVWVLPQMVGTWSRVIDFGNGAPSDNVVLTLDSGTNKIPILAVDIGTIYGKVYSSQSLTLNNWQHLAASFDGIQMKIFINGTLMSETDYPVKGSLMPTSLNRTYCYVGKSNWANNGFSFSFLDDLRFYNKSLSQSEINEVMNDLSSSK